MGVPNPLRYAAHPVLPGPFDTNPSPDGVRPTPAIQQLAESQVRALLAASPSYHQLSDDQRQQMERDLTKIAAYTAALVQEDFKQSQRLDLVPVLHQQTTVTPHPSPQSLEAPPRPLARAAAASDEFSPRAASQVARITRETLNAIAFPTFVADLIKGTFQAIVDASIQQMEAFANLLANVAKTVDHFMADNISDNMARDQLVASYPGHFRIDTTGDSPRVRVRDSADDLPRPDFRRAYGLPNDVDLSDESAEESLVPAARRQLAQNRQRLLATMVLMGMNRIVVTSGRIQAKMGFRIDAKDTGRVQTAREFDFKNETTASYGGGLAGWLAGGPKVETKNTVAYVSSTKKDSSDELDVHADLTGEVDLKFKTDYLPLERLANPEMIAAIQGNTPNPSANTPIQSGGASGGSVTPTAT